MKSSANERKTERLVSWVVLLFLAATAVAIFIKQFSFNPAVLLARQLAAGPSTVSTNAAGLDLAWSLPSVKPFGAAEQFTPDNLYDKIDGKAELYVSAGISRMDCRRFALKDAPDDWFEWFCYGMNGGPQAFSVFSTQRRAEAKTLDLTPNAYRTQNAIFFVAGTNYIEAVGSSGSEPLMAAMIAMGKRFVTTRGDQSRQVPETQVLPTNGMAPGTITLQTSDAFGFDGFKNVFTAEYKLGGADVTAFATTCASPETAKTLGDAYCAFLLANGGKERATSEVEFGRVIEIMDTYEVVFSSANHVAGVHSAPTSAVAAQLAAAIRAQFLPQAP